MNFKMKLKAFTSKSTTWPTGPPPLRRNSTRMRIPGSMWRSPHKTPSSRPAQYYTEDECSTLVNSFNSFFISKITKIQESIANTLAFHLSHPSLPGNSQVPQSQSSNLCLQKRFLSSFVQRPTSQLFVTLSTLQPLFHHWNFFLYLQKGPSSPLLKKPSLYPNSPANLSTMLKLLERLILSRIRPHITASSNSSFQSACRPGFLLLFHTSSRISLTYVARAIAPPWSILTSCIWHCQSPDTVDSAGYIRYRWRDLSSTLESMALHSLGYNLTFLIASDMWNLAPLLHSSWTSCWCSSGLCPGTFAFHNLHFTFIQHHDFELSFQQYADDTSLFSILSSHACPTNSEICGRHGCNQWLASR